MKPFAYIHPETVIQALSKKNKDAQFIAGGTNLVDLMKKDISQPDALVDVNTVLPATIALKEKVISIGAMARNSAVASHPDVVAHFPLLAKTILAGASPQIRNMASTSGNLLQRTRCPYFYDITLPCNKRNPGSGCSALHGYNRMSSVIGWSEQCVAVHPSDFCIGLAALDATVVTMDKTQKHTSIPFKDFHRLPGSTPQLDNKLPVNHIIHSVNISRNPFNKHFAYLKIRDRDSYAFALISVAAALQLDGNKIIEARLASGGVAHKPWRWYEAEQFLKGKAATADSFSKAAAIVIKDLRPLRENAFKKIMLQGAVETALQNCLTP